MSNTESIEKSPVLLRMTTVPLSLKYLINGQMRFMNDRGFQVHMASADGPERESVMENEQVPHHILPLTRRMTPVKDLFALGKTVRLIHSIEPDIVHTHTPKAGLIGMWAARMAGVSVRIHTLAGLPLKTLTGWKRKVLINTERWTYSSATEVWPNNSALLDFISTHKLVRLQKCHLIGYGSSNGIVPEKWSVEAADDWVVDRLKQEINYSEEHTYFLFVGRVVPEKGIPELISAFSEVQKTEGSIELILAGTLDELSSSEKLPPECLKTIRGRSDIHCPGWSDYIREWMALADALVFPSHREGFPNVLLQAGAMKLPVLCSDLPEHRSLIKNGTHGLLFPPKNVRGLSRTMKEFLRGKDRAERRADHLYLKVKEEFHREDIHREILERYRNLLDVSPH